MISSLSDPRIRLQAKPSADFALLYSHTTGPDIPAFHSATQDFLGSKDFHFGLCAGDSGVENLAVEQRRIALGQYKEYMVEFRTL
jgi:hypothetical protein